MSQAAFSDFRTKSFAPSAASPSAVTCQKQAFRDGWSGERVLIARGYSLRWRWISRCLWRLRLMLARL